MIKTLQDIETLVESIKVEFYQNHALVYDLELHITRLLNSIHKLSFKKVLDITDRNEFYIFFLTQIKNKLQYHFKATVTFLQTNNPLKVVERPVYKLRLVYHKDSKFEIEVNEYPKKKDVFKVKILNPKDFHINSQDEIWRHKFLPRYDFKDHFNDEIDEVIWLDETGAVCEGSYTSIVMVKDGAFITPFANTLPGTSLEKIKQAHGLEYQRITVEDLKSNEFILINSLLGAKEVLLLK